MIEWDDSSMSAECASGKRLIKPDVWLNRLTNLATIRWLAIKVSLWKNALLEELYHELSCFFYRQYRYRSLDLEVCEWRAFVRGILHGWRNWKFFRYTHSIRATYYIRISSLRSSTKYHLVFCFYSLSFVIPFEFRFNRYNRMSVHSVGFYGAASRCEKALRYFLVEQDGKLSAAVLHTGMVFGDFATFVLLQKYLCKFFGDFFWVVSIRDATLEVGCTYEAYYCSADLNTDPVNLLEHFNTWRMQKQSSLVWIRLPMVLSGNGRRLWVVLQQNASGDSRHVIQ